MTTCLASKFDKNQFGFKVMSMIGRYYLKIIVCDIECFLWLKNTDDIVGSRGAGGFL